MLARRSTLLAGFGALLAGSGAARAHHGWSGYDADHRLTLSGPVRAISFTNPHCTAEVEAAGKLWTCILAPLSRMTARGLPEGSIKVGDAVTVIGYASRTEPAEMRAEAITVGGQTVELR